VAPIDFGALSLGHCRSQVEPPLQLIEQLPMHLMWHVAPPEQSMLPLLPTVIAQVDMPVHLRLHDDPHWPVQSLVFAQSSEQLLSQVPAAISQDCPAGQLQEEPLHVGGVPLSLLQAADMLSPIVKATKMSLICPERTSSRAVRA